MTAKYEQMENGRTAEKPTGLLSLIRFAAKTQVDIIEEHGKSNTWYITAWVAQLAIPQYIFGLAFCWTLEGASVLLARVLAMNIVRELDKLCPYQRLLGLCHLSTFSFVLLFLLGRIHADTLTRISFGGGWLEMVLHGFVYYQIFVISACLFLDFRDVLLHCFTDQPYPCYIREMVQKGKLKIEKPVGEKHLEMPTLKQRLLW